MNTKKLFILYLFLSINSCGNINNLNLDASGYIDTTQVDVLTGPTFLIITNTDNLDLIEKNPAQHVITVLNIDNSGNYHIDFAQFGIEVGDIIYLIAFVDNDYDKDIPIPTVGDYVGFYIDPLTLNTAYTVKNENDINIKINREIYDFESSVKGVINGAGPGEVILIAYSGEITSMDFASINVDDIIGYKKIIKTGPPYEYNLSIMPYGKNVPIENVQLIALLDKNSNGIPDEGDRVGFHRNNIDHMPEAITVENGDNPGVDIGITKRIYNFSTSINYKFNPNNHPGDLDPGDNLITFVVHTDGIDGENIDADYVLGMKNMPLESDQNHVYTFNLYNFIDEDLGDLYSGDDLPVNIITIFDRNGNGLPDSGENIAAYWDAIFIFGMIYFPKEYKLILDSSNTLSNPDNLRFINKEVP